MRSRLLNHKGALRNLVSYSLTLAIGTDLNVRTMSNKDRGLSYLFALQVSILCYALFYFTITPNLSCSTKVCASVVLEFLEMAIILAATKLHKAM
jgi:hypothetical protein